MDEALASVDGLSFRTKKVSKHSNNRYEDSSLNSEQNEFLKEYQNYSFRTIDQSPEHALVNKSATISLNESPATLRKKGIVEQLNQKNEMLRREVLRVQKILSMGDRPKQKFIPQINDEVLKQELSNAYKQIRIYENEVTQRKKMFENEGAYVDLIRKAELTLLERHDMVRRLEAQVSETNKQSNELMKLLQDGHIKKQYANKSSRLHKQIKYYENMLKDEAALEVADNDNMIKKRIFIKKMEEELVSTGFSKAELALLRKKFQAERTAPSVVAKSQVPNEDRSKAAFDNLKGQMAILSKMQKDYLKKIEQLQRQKNQATAKSRKSKQIMDQAEKQFDQTQRQLTQRKKSIDPSKMRPNVKNSSNPYQSAFSQFAGQKSTNPLDHRFEAVEAGYYNKRATVVNDRLIIGRKSGKIIGLTIYQNRTQFLGLQALYLVNDVQKKGGTNVLKRQNQRFFKQKTTKLQQGDYFKSISCAISKDNIITGIIFVSFYGTVVKAGFVQGMKMDLPMEGKEYPCCLYGSYSERGFEMLGAEKVQSG